MCIEIVEMRPADYQAVWALWEATDGVGLDASDQLDRILGFLQRNPGLSLVARDISLAAHGQIVAAVIGGHDGRRGYLSHLAVSASHRGNGLGRQLVEMCLARLADEGILKCNVRVFVENQQASQFWQRLGFAPRSDLVVLQRETGWESDGKLAAGEFPHRQPMPPT